PLDVGHLAHAAAHRKRNEYFRGHGLDDGQYQVAIVAGGGNVKKGEFVGALLVVAARDLDGVTGIDQIDEVHALYNPPCRNVETGDDAPRKRVVHRDVAGAHGAPSSSARSWAAAKSSVPS